MHAPYEWVVTLCDWQNGFAEMTLEMNGRLVASSVVCPEDDLYAEACRLVRQAQRRC